MLAAAEASWRYRHASLWDGLMLNECVQQDFIEASRLTTFKCKYQRTDDYGGQTKGFKFETHKVCKQSCFPYNKGDR